MNVEQVRFRSGPSDCAGDLYLPEGTSEQAPVPAVVMGHSVVMVKEALGPHAAYLVQAGFAVLAIDYRTIGASGGEPRCQWIPEWQIADIRAGVSFLQSRAEIDPERIGAWGHSTGGAVAIMAGVLDRRIKAVACQNPSMLDAWPALEKSLGRTQMGNIRHHLQNDFDRRYDTGHGAVMPALPSGDPKLSGYIAQSEDLFPTFKNEMTLESFEHVLLWAPAHFLHRLGPTPLLMISGVEDELHAIDEVLDAYQRAHEPKQLRLLQVDEYGLSIEPGLGESMHYSCEFFDEHLRKAPLFVPSPTPGQARAQGLRPEYRETS